MKADRNAPMSSEAKSSVPVTEGDLPGVGLA